MVWFGKCELRLARPRTCQPHTASSTPATHCLRPNLTPVMGCCLCCCPILYTLCAHALFVCLRMQLLRGSFPASAIKSYPDVFYVEYFAATEDVPGGDLFFFDYGVVACWCVDGPHWNETWFALHCTVLCCSGGTACIFGPRHSAASTSSVRLAGCGRKSGAWMWLAG